MSISIAVGMQWGDEGKGRVVDLLSEKADLVARFNGGDNAGHTVTVGEKIFKLHLIPSGIIHPHTTGILGNGLVINPATLLDEIDQLTAAGVNVSPDRLWISDSAHLITPAHRLLDQAQEAARGANQIGTTGRGIGPAYVDKSARKGLRTGSILEENFAAVLQMHFADVSNTIVRLYGQPALDVEQLTAEYLRLCTRLQPYIRNTGSEIRQAAVQKKNILAEAAQGTLLDLDHGSYPFVTSSCTTACGVFSGLGLGLQPVDRVIGITKAFQTRVGAGPFPTECAGEIAARLRGTGANPWDEFGTTTGRPRRVGWLDLVLLKYAIELNGATELFLTKLDILSGFDEISYCNEYVFQGKSYTALSMPGGASTLAGCKPVYTAMTGWHEDVSAMRHWRQLPKQAHNYIARIEEFCAIPVSAVSVGPERSAVIYRE